MATKKAASNAHKTAVKRPVAKKQTSTKVTTVKAVEPTHVSRSAAARRSFTMGGRSVNYTSLLSAALAELVGTFILGAVVLSQGGQPVPVLFGSAAAVLAVGVLSGAHLNPGITVGAWVTRRISVWRALCYIVAQILGGMLALIVVNAFVKGATGDASNQMQALGQTATLFHAASLPTGKEWLVLWAELLGSSVFMFAVASSYSVVRSQLNKALTYGTALFTALLIAGTATASLAQGGGLTFLNPAIAIAAQVFNHFSVWTIVIYMLMPLVGGVIGFGLHDLLRAGRAAETDATL